MIEFDVFDVFAFVVFGILLAATVVIIVLVGALPGRIAARCNHPYAKAVTAAGWISLLTLGALWPIAFIWAFIPPPPNRSDRSGGDERTTS